MEAMGMGVLGVRATWIEAESALPGAPTVPDGRRARRRRPRRVGIARPRAAAARALHRAADLVAPRGETSGGGAAMTACGPGRPAR